MSTHDHLLAQIDILTHALRQADPEAADRIQALTALTRGPPVTLHQDFPGPVAIEATMLLGFAARASCFITDVRIEHPGGLELQFVRDFDCLRNCGAAMFDGEAMLVALDRRQVAELRLHNPTAAAIDPGVISWNGYAV